MGISDCVPSPISGIVDVVVTTTPFSPVIDLNEGVLQLGGEGCVELLCIDSVGLQ